MTSPLRRCALLALIAGCASPTSPPPTIPPQHESVLDGPIEYSGGSGLFGGSWTLRIELDGSVTQEITTYPIPSDPGNGEIKTVTTTGTVAPPAIDELRDDVAAIDFTALRDDYRCELPACNNADQGAGTLTIPADGDVFEVDIDARFPRAELPPGLAQLLEDIDAIELQ